MDFDKEGKYVAHKQLEITVFIPSPPYLKLNVWQCAVNLLLTLALKKQQNKIWFMLFGTE